MSLFTVTITGVSAAVEVYGGSTACDDYLLSGTGAAQQAYASLVADDRKRLLVAATRYVDRLSWQGTANAGGGTTLQWPRTGVVNPDSSAVDPATVPPAIVTACFELVGLLAVDADVQSAPDSGGNVKRLDASGTSIEFFRPTSALDGTATTLPQTVNQLVGKWLKSALAIAAATGASYGGGQCVCTGTCSCSCSGNCSSFTDCDTLSRGSAF